MNAVGRARGGGYADAVKQHVERELKLEPGEGFTMPELGGRPLPSRTFLSTYHDTPDLVLARHGVTFRHRTENGTGVWQLKLPKGVARMELEVAGPPARPPAEMLALLVALLRGREVVPVARLRTRREGVRAQGAEVTEDSVAVLVGQRVTRRFHELEVELLEDGDERSLRRLERELRRAGARAATHDQRPKLHQALDLAAPDAETSIPAGALPAVALGLALAEQRRRLLLHDPGTRLGADPEELHQMRVATRRLRAFLRVGRPLLDRAWVDGLRAELGWLGRELGPARDLDVLVERIQADVDTLGPDGPDAAGLVVGLEAERVAARSTVVEALTGERYLALLDRLDTIGEPPLSGDDPTLADLWRRQWKRTRRAVADLPPVPTDDELHAIRISIKRARYAAELAGHELGAKGTRFVAAAKDVQDVLGEHQDATVAEERIRAWADAVPEAAIAAGRLVQLERDRRAAMRAAWPGAWGALRAAARKLL